MAKEDAVVLSDEERKVLLVAINNAISGCNRSASKAGLDLVKAAYAKQALVLSTIAGRLR